MGSWAQSRNRSYEKGWLDSFYQSDACELRHWVLPSVGTGSISSIGHIMRFRALMAPCFAGCLCARQRAKGRDAKWFSQCLLANIARETRKCNTGYWQMITYYYSSQTEQVLKKYNWLSRFYCQPFILFWNVYVAYEEVMLAPSFYRLFKRRLQFLVYLLRHIHT